MTDNPIELPPNFPLNNGQYRIEQVLGSGGFGITYRAFDTDLERSVAIKEYLPDCAMRTQDSRVVPRTAGADTDTFNWGGQAFLKEAQILARFQHHNIVRIHSRFQANGTGYFVMEYAGGTTLSKWLEQRGSLDGEQVKAILLPLIDGLKLVHEAGVMHRDIKPDNMIMRPDGSPLLIDFGAARLLVASKSRAVTSLVTPGYAPIEQYSSKEPPGPWNDIYALGAVAYQLLTGKIPDEAVDRISADPLIPAREAARGRASAAFLEAIDTALKVFKDQRPQALDAWQRMLVADHFDASLQRDTIPDRNAIIETTQSGRINKKQYKSARKRKNSRNIAELAPEMVLIQAGAFDMGSPDRVPDKKPGWVKAFLGSSNVKNAPSEHPQHHVQIEKPFYLAKYPTTVGAFKRFTNAPGNEGVLANAGKGAWIWNGYDWVFEEERSWRDPGFTQEDNHPVVCISWDDAQKYIEWLNRKTGQIYRLPSEAEWEYAARAGTVTRYFFGDKESQLADYAWYWDNSNGATKPVGTKPPNPWGLYDMLGNVSEWCEDAWHDDYTGAPNDGTARIGGDADSPRVVRGGSWNGEPWRVRSAGRGGSTLGGRSGNLGFRLSRI